MQSLFRILVQAVILIGLAASGYRAQAQFQQPTEEELKMTSDPKAPGAAAVYLNYEEKDDDVDNGANHAIYARIKVLGEEGKKLGTVTLDFANVSTRLKDQENTSDKWAYSADSIAVGNLFARVIHADGTVVPFNGKPVDEVLLKMNDITLHRVTFTLPGVEVGSIIEYRYKFSYNGQWAPYWLIQKPYYVHDSSYSFARQRSNARLSDSAQDNGATPVLYTQLLPNGTDVRTDAQQRYSLVAKDVAALANEAFSPPVSSFAEQVRFYYPLADKAAFATATSGSPNAYWEAATKVWSGDVDRLGQLKGGLKGAGGGIVAGASSDEEKAKKLYDAIQALDNTDYTRKRGTWDLKQTGYYEERKAEDVWKSKSGTSDELAILYVALARSVALKAYAEKVVNRDRGLFNNYYLSRRQLDDVIVVLELNGKEMQIDPGSKYCPFGLVSWEHQLAGGIRQTSGKPELSTSAANPYAASTLTRAGDLTLDDKGAISGSVNMAMTGSYALMWRQASLRKSEDELKAAFNAWAQSTLPPDVKPALDHFEGLKDPNAPLVAVVKLSGSNASAAAGKVSLPAALFDSAANSDFATQQYRSNPIDIHFGGVVKDVTTYHLPATLPVAALPSDKDASWPDHAMYSLKSSKDGSAVTVTRMLSQAFVLLDASNYSSLHDFYQQAAAADQQSLTLSAN